MDPIATSNDQPHRPVVRAPLVSAVLCMTAGIAFGRYLDMPTVFWGFGCGAMLIAAAVSFRRRELHLITSVALGLAILSLTATYARFSYYHIPDDHVVTYTSSRPILATLRGRIVTSPIRISDTTGVGYRRPDRTRFILDADELSTDDGYVSVGGLVQVTIAEPADGLSAGQKVELVGTMGRFRSPANPGQFDHAAAARANNTLAWLTVPSPQGATPADEAPMPFYMRAYWNLRATARQHLSTLGSDADGHLLNAMIIGERHSSLGGLNRAMVDAGISHFLSISGLHLGVFLGFIYTLARLVRLTPRRSAVAVLIVLGAYLLLSEPRAPLLRSAMMAVALCASVIFRRKYSSLNALAGAAIVLLVMDPMQLFLPGFQLSFAIVAGLIVLYRPVRQMLFGRWLRRRGLIVFRNERSFRRWSQHTLADWLINGLTVSLVAYLTAAPLVAYHFGLFSPYAVLLNVLLFPLVVAVLLPGYLSMALLWPLPGLAYSIGRVAAAAADLLTDAVEIASQLPYLSMQLHPLGIGWLVLAYLTIFAVVFHKHIPFGKLAAVIALTGLCVWTFNAQRPISHGETELHLLAVGAGQCVMLTTPAGGSYLFDAGTMSGYDAAAKVIKPFLNTRRIAWPQTAFISHANSDHFNALGPMLAGPDLQTVYMNDYFANGPRGPSWGESAPAELLDQIDASGASVKRLRSGDMMRLDGQTTVKVLWPPSSKRSNLSSNDTSLVLLIDCAGRTILLTGDIGEVPQRELLTMYRNIKADILVLPHHGGWTKALPQFIEAVDPEVVLVSSARPKPRTAVAGDVKDEFFAHLMGNRRYYSTARNGYIRASFNGSKTRVETMR